MLAETRRCFGLWRLVLTEADCRTFLFRETDRVSFSVSAPKVILKLKHGGKIVAISL